MRKALGVFAASVLLVVLGASLGMADTVSFTYGGSMSFTSNDALYWGAIGANVPVASGTTVQVRNQMTMLPTGNVATITFGNGGAGTTYVQCPASACSWNGDFSPGQFLLSNGGTAGSIDVSFTDGVSGVGFNAMPFQVGTYGIEIGAYDGTTLLGSAEFGLIGGPVGGDNNSASFYSVVDSTGADITAIKLSAYDCLGAGNCFPLGLTINNMLLNAPTTSSTPEPASLALLGSGLGLFGFLRRKLGARK